MTYSRKLLLILICAFTFLLTACTDVDLSQTQDTSVSVSASSETEATVEPVNDEAPVVEDVSKIKYLVPGTQAFGYEEEFEPLDKELEDKFLEIMDFIYQSLATYQIQETEQLIEDDTHWKALLGYLGLTIDIRSLQETDFTISNYDYKLNARYGEDLGDGNMLIVMVEDATYQFTGLSKPTEAYNVYRSAKYYKDDEGHYHITDFVIYDSLRSALTANLDWYTDHAEEYLELIPEYYEKIVAAHQDRLLHSYVFKEIELPKAKHPYDVEAALEYATTYIGQRNNKYDDYSKAGGNCQNFASQCLRAGGIPMDISYPGVWKWYGWDVQNDGTKMGRTSSWTSPKWFVDYANKNVKVSGLVSVTDFPYFSAQPGDLLHMGYDGDLYHTVVVAEPIVNAAGRVVDYLVYSNTSDLRNYPASIYGYPEICLTRIIGWN